MSEHPKYGDSEEPVSEETQKRLIAFYGVDLVEKAEKIKQERRAKIRKEGKKA